MNSLKQTLISLSAFSLYEQFYGTFITYKTRCAVERPFKSEPLVLYDFKTTCSINVSCREGWQTISITGNWTNAFQLTLPKIAPN